MLHELLGQPNVKNYDGSWTEYGSLVGVPIENELTDVRCTRRRSETLDRTPAGERRPRRPRRSSRAGWSGTASRSRPRTSGCSTRTGEFTAEVVSSASGAFRFFAAPGTWTVRALAPGASGSADVEAGLGFTETRVEIS